MADKNTPSTGSPAPADPAAATPSPVAGRTGPSAKDVNMPVNPRADTEKAAEAAIKTSEARDFTPSVEKGADKDFNTWMRKAHENGNPEQLTPMQAEQNIRDRAAAPAAGIAAHHDLSDPDTRWVVKNVLNEEIPDDAENK